MSLLPTFTFVCLFLVCMAFAHVDPEVKMNVPDIISKRWGYPVQVYEVQTQDGYILEMHRIPYGKEGPGKGIRPIMFLQHGLLCSSSNWVTNLPRQSAAFLFADHGFDVWMGNFRGNTYGRKHKTLSPRSDEFWKFSWDEMAKYDLETMIDFALNTTGHSQLYYTAHSQGCLSAFAKFSTDLEFGKKIKKFFALAPVVTVGHIGGVIRKIAPLAKQITAITNLFGSGEFLPSNIWIKMTAKYICGSHYTSVICEDVMFMIAGANSHQLNESRAAVYVAHTPAGTSTQNVLHFAQGVNSNRFQAFDYGSSKRNSKHYGQSYPPLYPLEQMEVETYAFYGDNDVLGDPTDVEPAMKRVKNLKYMQKCTDFNHLDFIWGLRAAPEIYMKIIDIIDKEDQSNAAQHLHFSKYLIILCIVLYNTVHLL